MKARFFLAAIMGLAWLSPTGAAPPADLDEHAGRAMRTFEVPGMAVAIVEGDQTFSKGYGVRRFGKAGRVDEHSLFSLASNTKAFTAAAAAILVREGKLDWDDPVIDWLPGFRMYDPWVTRELTLRDVLAHRSGLGETTGELLYFPATDFSRSEILHRVRYLKPATSLRSQFAYSNIGFVVAGEVVASAAGQSWESFVQQRLFNPLGMRDSVVSFKDLKERGLTKANFAWPHVRIGGPSRWQGDVRPVDPIADDDNVAAAGAIYASAADMTRWMRLQLDQGLVRSSGKRLYGVREAKEMWTPQIMIPGETATGPLALTVPSEESYALGWRVKDYRGHKIIAHSGSSVGTKVAAAFLPERKIGVWVMVNSDDGGARWATFYHLLDHYLGLPPVDWVANYREVADTMIAKALQSQKAAAIPTTEPGRPAVDYVGTYCDPAYGTITVDQVEGAARLRFDRTPGMISRLRHVRLDSFRTDFPKKWFEDAYVNFARNADGSIREVNLRSVYGEQSNYSDLDFRPLTAGAACGAPRP